MATCETPCGRGQGTSSKPRYQAHSGLPALRPRRISAQCVSCQPVSPHCCSRWRSPPPRRRKPRHRPPTRPPRNSASSRTGSPRRTRSAGRPSATPSPAPELVPTLPGRGDVVLTVTERPTGRDAVAIAAALPTRKDASGDRAGRSGRARLLHRRRTTPSRATARRRSRRSSKAARRSPGRRAARRAGDVTRSAWTASAAAYDGDRKSMSGAALSALPSPT